VCSITPGRPLHQLDQVPPGAIAASTRIDRSRPWLRRSSETLRSLDGSLVLQLASHIVADAVATTSRRLMDNADVHETDQDLRELQTRLDRSYARAGQHLRSIWGPETRLDAASLSGELAGVQVLDLATVTPRGEPRVAPVDGLFFRGRFWFGSAEDSLRFRNIRANPAVSGVVTRGLETFLVIVHGRAVETDPRGARASGFADYPRELYDFDWDAVHPHSPYAWIDATTMLAFKRT
jgi:hypothetical protein